MQYLALLIIIAIVVIIIYNYCIENYTPAPTISCNCSSTPEKYRPYNESRMINPFTNKSYIRKIDSSPETLIDSKISKKNQPLCPQNNSIVDKIGGSVNHSE